MLWVVMGVAEVKNCEGGELNLLSRVEVILVSASSAFRRGGCKVNEASKTEYKIQAVFDRV